MGNGPEPVRDGPPQFGLIKRELEISQDDLAQYLTDVANLPCEACGSEAWSVDESDEGRTTHIYNNYFHDVALGAWSYRYIATVVFICSNCGNLRMIARRSIETWLKRKRKGGGS